jgi:signal transduction histidine kinase
MTKFVPYLTEEAIERDAVALLAEYAHARGVIIAPPIPIDDIVEKHLKLGIEFDDTHRRFGVPRESGQDPDILGAIFFDTKRIVIDESLDPEENPAKEGRYRFTLAHEGGGRSDQHATDQVLVAVKDSGIGLDPENLDRLFIVTRAPSSRRR